MDSQGSGKSGPFDIPIRRHGFFQILGVDMFLRAASFARLGLKNGLQELYFISLTGKDGQKTPQKETKM
jgi:hypothetical protein